ncbi:tetratricopeptide repeat protein [Oceanidesulfovibrio marinus]|uniref:Uncharacterized protein n=1 Tax=Oceanidesulfovibrio marinus TaxID=370038 RepID=A0A6P1ZEP1_9BACT|nr:hypothetical protein [Oceanidesulfovibrio marinus]TVM32872.1 hypothetical protein DQK91_14295 [Oceanidesulfovibrio marinus]
MNTDSPHSTNGASVTPTRRIPGVPAALLRLLPAGIEAPVAAAVLMLILAAIVLVFYGVIVTTHAFGTSGGSESPETLFRRGRIGESLARGARRVQDAMEEHGQISPESGSAYIALAQLQESSGDRAQALDLLDQAGLIADRLAQASPQEAALCYLDLAAVYLETGELSRAEKAAAHAADIAAKVGDPDLRIRALSLLGVTLANADRSEISLRAFQQALALAEKLPHNPLADRASLRLDAARAAILSKDGEQVRALLHRVRADLDGDQSPEAILAGLHASALEARMLAAENHSASAVELAHATLGVAGTLPADLQQRFARNAGPDLLEAMNLCAAQPAGARSALGFLERLDTFFGDVLPANHPLRIHTLELLADLDSLSGNPKRSLAVNARLLAAQTPPMSLDRAGNGFDSLMDRDDRLMQLLARLAAAEAPSQKIATLAFGSWLSRRVLFPPTGMPALPLSSQADDSAAVDEFVRLTAAMASARPDANVHGLNPVAARPAIQPASFSDEARTRLEALSQAIAERHEAWRPLLQWMLGRYDGYTSAVASLAATLPRDGGLLLFARIKTPPGAGHAKSEEPHIVAFLLTRPAQDGADSRIDIINIGPVGSVEKVLRVWRSAGGEDSQPQGTDAVASGLAEVELYSRLWTPIRRAAPHLATIWIGPGDPPSRGLANLPFESLPTPEGRPLGVATTLKRLDRDALLDAMRTADQPAIVGLLGNEPDFSR